MKKIELNYWFIKDNTIQISLMRFYIEITILKNNDSIYYKLEVIDNSKTELIFNFYTLEDAITFTEEIINSCYTIEEISTIYIEEFKKGKYQPLKNKSKKKIKKK